jgi:hypothetical protein
MELTVEQFGDLPDFMKEQFEEVEGKYLSIDSLKLQKVKSTADNLDKELKLVRGEFSTLKESFTQEQQRKADEIKAARDSALEEATSKGESAKIKELYEQKMADLEQRSYERGKLEASNEFKQQSLASEAAAIRGKLAAKLGRDEDSQSAIEMLLSNMLKPSDGSIGFFDAKGSALSIDDINQFETDVIKKSPMFKHLIKPDVIVSGAGLANGGAAVNAGTKLNRSTMSAEQKYEYIKEYDQQAFLKLPK